jgi:hypothetical protein
VRWSPQGAIPADQTCVKVLLFILIVGARVMNNSVRELAPSTHSLCGIQISSQSPTVNEV